MIIDEQYYDVIIIGTGAGGGTLAYKLAPTGKKILVLERGGFMPLEEQNRSNVDVFRKERYHASERWLDVNREPFSPQTNYAIGGNTKIYGATLMRMRERDFEEVNHYEGISPAWGLKYRDFEPYYTEAEQLYKVHGQVTDDPTEPPRSKDYPYPAQDHDPQVKDIVEALVLQGLHPAPIPLGLTRQTEDPTNDSEVSGIVPALSYPNITVKTSAKVVSLHTNPTGREIKAVEADVAGQSYLFMGDVIVLSCGAINSATLLLRSANDACPNGVANSTGLVGRNLMKHRITSVVQLSTRPNTGKFPRSIVVNNYYWGDQDFPYPMGQVQNTGGLLQDIIFAESPPLLSVFAKVMPGFGLKQMATHSIGWWVQTEDLPNPTNRVRLQGDKIHLDYTPNNTEAHERLVYFWTEVLKEVDRTRQQRGGLYPYGEMPISVVANQCGTCRFGEDSTNSVLDLNCRSHDIDNLYVVDSSFFPSNANTSPALTIIANALRVGEHLIERLK